jgi:hypothetical protein|tara:strand:- start:288 stop:470 length:183 start_codon:yes stop_codon:yes gene_type:complete
MVKSNFHNKAIESMQNIAKDAKKRGYTYLDIISIIWIAFDFGNDSMMRKYFKNWITDKGE